MVAINDQTIGQQLEPGGSFTVDYLIAGQEKLVIHLASDAGGIFEKEVTDELNKTVSPENYGRVLVTVKEKKGTIELSVLKNIS